MADQFRALKTTPAEAACQSEHCGAVIGASLPTSGAGAIHLEAEKTPFQITCSSPERPWWEQRCFLTKAGEAPLTAYHPARPVRTTAVQRNGKGCYAAAAELLP